MSKTTDQLLTVKQLGERLQIGKTKVYELRAAGQLPKPIKLGRCVRWRASEISSWINAGCPSLQKFEKMKGAR